MGRVSPSVGESEAWKRKRQMPRFPLERYSGYVHIDREAKEDDHDRFEKRKGEKLDETRGGKCLEKMFKEREKSGCKKDSIKLEQGKT